MGARRALLGGADTLRFDSGEGARGSGRSPVRRWESAKGDGGLAAAAIA